MARWPTFVANRNMRVVCHRPAVGIGQRDLILSDPAAGTSLVFEKPGMTRSEGHGQNCPQITEGETMLDIISVTILAGALAGRRTRIETA